MAGIGTINIGGLASGLNTQELIENLMKIDSQPLNRLESQKEDIAEVSSIFTSMKTKLQDFQNIASELRSASTLNAFSASSSDEEALGVSASSSAENGNYTVKILSLAQAEARSSNSFSDNDSGLGFSGEISVNGKSISVDSTYSLIDIRDAINTLDSGVKANILKVGTSDYRLVLSSETQGSQSFMLADVGNSELLDDLGFTDGTTRIRQVNNGAVVSGAFDAANTTVGSLIGIEGNAAGTVSIRGKDITIDLSTDSLASIRDKVNNLELSGVTATIKTIEEDDATTYRLEITGTTEFIDDGSVLETLGVLAGGTSGIKAEYATGTLYKVESGNYADESTFLHQLGAKAGNVKETVTISGYTAGGESVSNTIIIEEQTTVSDLLTAIEDTYNGDVTASIVNGVIMLQSVGSGETALSIDIAANNEDGGTLDFGAISETVRGRNRVVVEGTDAEVLVNNIKVTRTSNEIDDAIGGLTLDLKKADPETVLAITVDQDNSAIKEKINNFVDSFNSFVEYYNTQSSYNEETEKAGPLLGNLTARTAMDQLLRVVQTTVNDQSFLFTQLAQIGIGLTTEGTLDIETAMLDDALNEDPQAVIDLFTVTRNSSDRDISFIYSSSKSTPGTYDVNITTAAEKAFLQSEVITGRLGTNGTVSLTDDHGASLDVEYSDDMTVSDMANKINEEAQSSYTKVLTSDSAFTSANDIESISQTTNIGDLSGVTVKNGDTITITGTKRSGASYQRVLTFDDGDSYSMQDILNQVSVLNGGNVTASLDSTGHIVLMEQQSGSSKLALSIESTIDGLDFGTFEVSQAGRTSVNIEAMVTSDNRLQIIHKAYGSAKSFAIEGGNAIGIENGTYAGVDIAGTINGVEGTGKGTALTASTFDKASRGIIIASKITAAELAEKGPLEGSVTLVAGIAERMFSQLESLTDSVNGFIQTQLDSYETEQDLISTQIDNMTSRLEQRRTLYVRRFTQLEVALSRLQSVQDQLTSSLNSLR